MKNGAKMVLKYVSTSVISVHMLILTLLLKILKQGYDGA